MNTPSGHKYGIKSHIYALLRRSRGPRRRLLPPGRHARLSQSGGYLSSGGCGWAAINWDIAARKTAFGVVPAAVQAARNASASSVLSLQPSTV